VQKAPQSDEKNRNPFLKSVSLASQNRPLHQLQTGDICFLTSFNHSLPIDDAHEDVNSSNAFSSRFRFHFSLKSPWRCIDLPTKVIHIAVFWPNNAKGFRTFTYYPKALQSFCLTSSDNLDLICT